MVSHSECLMSQFLLKKLPIAQNSWCYDFKDIILAQTDNLNSQSEKLRKVLKNRSGLEY